MSLKVEVVTDARMRLISAAHIGTNQFHQYRSVSWQTSMPRSCSRTSALRR